MMTCCGKDWRVADPHLEHMTNETKTERLPHHPATSIYPFAHSRLLNKHQSEIRTGVRGVRAATDQRRTEQEEAIHCFPCNWKWKCSTEFYFSWQLIPTPLCVVVHHLTYGLRRQRSVERALARGLPPPLIYTELSAATTVILCVLGRDGTLRSVEWASTNAYRRVPAQSIASSVRYRTRSRPEVQLKTIRN